LVLHQRPHFRRKAFFTCFRLNGYSSRRVSPACNPPLALMWAPGLSTRQESVRQPFSRPVAGCPAPWSLDSHPRSCLLAPSITSAYLERQPPLKQKRCPSARWLHKSEPHVLFGPHLPSIVS
jgi:hypothetical protein